MSGNANAEELEIRKEGNAYVVIGPNGQVGEITYRLADVNTWILDHTYLDPEYRGGNLAPRMLDFVVEEAREKGRKIVPACSYALAQFRRNPDKYGDVWERGHGEYSDPYSTESAVSPER